MAKTYKTIFLEKRVKKYFQDRYDICLYNEVAVYDTSQIYFPYGKPYPVGAVDLGTTVFIKGRNYPYDLGVEIKVSKSDLCAKTGHNHFLDINFLAVPEYLVENAKRYLEKRKLSWVGLLSVSGKGYVKEIEPAEIIPEPRLYIDLSTEEYEGF